MTRETVEPMPKISAMRLYWNRPTSPQLMAPTITRMREIQSRALNLSDIGIKVKNKQCIPISDELRFFCLQTIYRSSALSSAPFLNIPVRVTCCAPVFSKVMVALNSSPGTSVPYHADSLILPSNAPLGLTEPDWKAASLFFTVILVGLYSSFESKGAVIVPRTTTVLLTATPTSPKNLLCHSPSAIWRGESFFKKTITNTTTRTPTKSSGKTNFCI